MEKVSLRIDATKIAGLLEPATRVVPAKTPVPAVGGILLEFAGNKISATGTNLETRVKSTIKLEGEEFPSYSVVLPVKTCSLIKSLGNQEVTIEIEDNKAMITNTSGNFSVMGMDSGGYPDPLPEDPDSTNIFYLDAPRLKEMFERVGFSVASAVVSRPVFAGICLEGDGENLRMMASDTYRLAADREAMQGIEKFKKSVPYTTLKETVRVDSEGRAKLEFKKGGFVASVSGEDIETRVESPYIEGDFPSLESITPKDITMELEVPREHLQEALSRVLLFTDSSVDLIPDSSNLVLEALGASGTSRESISVSGKGEGPDSVKLNPGFVKDPLSVLKSKTVELRMTQNPTIPIIMKQANWQYFICPLATK